MSESLWFVNTGNHASPTWRAEALRYAPPLPLGLRQEWCSLVLIPETAAISVDGKHWEPAR